MGMSISLPIIASYVTASVVTFYKPQILSTFFPSLNHGRARHMVVTHSSHRGGAAERPENTLTAFDHAVSLNSNLLELDVHLTRDGHVVVTHDHTIDRVTSGTGQVTSYRHADIPNMKQDLLLPPPFHPPGSLLDWRPSHAPPTNTTDHNTFPLLDTVFERYPNTNINIDCKHESQELVNQVATLIEKHKREHRTIWGSGSDVTSQRCYARNPNIPLFFSGKQTLYLGLKYITGLLPFMPIKESALEIPLLTPELRDNFGHFPLLTPTRKFFLNHAVSVYHFLFTRPSLIQHLQQRGIKVIYWVLNTESEFEQAFALGADGVMTDYPTRLRQYLDKHPHPPGQTSSHAHATSSSSHKRDL